MPTLGNARFGQSLERGPIANRHGNQLGAMANQRVESWQMCELWKSVELASVNDANPHGKQDADARAPAYLLEFRDRVGTVGCAGDGGCRSVSAGTNTALLKAVRS